MAENSNKKQTIMEAVRLAYENSKKINGYEGDDSSKHLKANKVSYSPEDTAYITSSCTDVNQAINIIDSYVKNGLDTANLKITGISYVNGITKIGEHASFDNNSTSIFGVRFTGDATVFSSGVTVNGGLSVSGSSTFSGSVGLPYGTTVKGPDGQTANLWDKISSAAAPTAQNVYGVTKDSDTVTREIDPADGKLKFTAKGGGVGVIELTEAQVNSIKEDGTITFTAEQANLIKQDNIGFIVAKYQGSSFYKLSVSKATIRDDSIYTLGGFAEFAPGFPFAITLSVADFTQPAKILYRGLPEYYLSTVEIDGDDSLVFSQNDDVNNIRNIYVDKINGDPIIHNNIAVVRDHSFVENKAVPFLGKYSVLIPDYSTDVTILPCDGDDNGKVLTVVNGEASWATPTGNVTVTFED